MVPHHQTRIQATAGDRLMIELLGVEAALARMDGHLDRLEDIHRRMDALHGGGDAS